MDHRGARVLGQLPRGDQGGDRRRRDRLAALVDHEAPVGVAVEGQPEVGAVLDGRRAAGRPGSPGPAGWPRGWGRCRPARSRAARSAAAAPAARRRRARPARCSRPSRCRRRPPPSAAGCRTGRPACAGRRRSRRAGRAARPAGPARPAGATRPRPAGPGPGRRISASPLSWPIGRAPGAAHLDAVVLRRVVAGGEHRAGQAQRAGGEVEHVGRGRARSRSPRAPRPRTPAANAAARPGPDWPACRARSTTASPASPASRSSLREGGAQRLGDPLVQLVGHGPTDVVRLDDLGQIRHWFRSLAAGCQRT